MPPSTDEGRGPRRRGRGIGYPIVCRWGGESIADEFISEREALLGGLTMTTTDQGVSVERAERRYELQGAFNEAAHVFEQANPEDVVASGISADPTSRPSTCPTLRCALPHLRLPLTPPLLG